MEIGAVKHALNSEIIRIKAGLNQARTHTINKLTRKSKVFKMRKGPDKILEKFNRKAEAYLSEVFIIKKIKAKELVRFAITCDGNLQKYIEHPEVNKEKAMARLLLHKSLIDKTNLLKKMFGNMPIEELMMTRRERLKIKKEKKEKEKKEEEKKLSKDKHCAEEDDDGEDDLASEEDDDYSGEEEEDDSDDDDDDDDKEEHLDSDDLDDLQSSADKKGVNYDELKKEKLPNTLVSDEDLEIKTENISDDDERESLKLIQSELLGNKKIFLDEKDSNLPLSNTLKQQSNNKTILIGKHDIPTITDTKTAPTKKSTAKNKKKVKPQVKKKGKLQRLQKSECVIDDEQKAEGKIVDSFFITSTGNYKTLAEPRLPDDLGKVDYSKNRQMRRAAAFGRTYKPKLNKNYKEQQSLTGRQDRYQDKKPERHNRFNKVLSSKKEDHVDDFPRKKCLTDVGSTFSKKPILDKRKSALIETKNVKIHPSWEAKKKASGIQAFQGKKVVFDNE